MGLKSFFSSILCQGPRTKHFHNIGHRGACATEIENTLPSCIKAIDQGANALEIDISFTKDNIPVLWHDFDPDDIIAIARQMGLESDKFADPVAPRGGDPFRRPVPELTLAELRENFGYRIRRQMPGYEEVTGKIPTLEEFFQVANMYLTPELELVFLDLKITEDYKHLLDPLLSEIEALIQKYQPKFQIVLMSAKEFVFYTKKVGFEYTIDLELPPGVILKEERWSPIRAARFWGNNYASVGLSVLGQITPWNTYKRIIRSAVTSKGSIKLFAWTINEDSKMRCLIKLGVDGIVTDYPEKLAKISQRLLPTTASGY